MPNRTKTYFVKIIRLFGKDELNKQINLFAIHCISAIYQYNHADIKYCQVDIVLIYCQLITKMPGSSKEKPGI